MAEKLRKLTGGNMDIDLIPGEQVSWEIEPCPWNMAEGTSEHKCAVKNVSLCKYFRGVEYPDTVLCSYPEAE